MTTPVRVLLVDDHAVVAQALSLSLGRADDIEVVGRAGSLLRARELTAQLRPDVVLLDQQLPDGDGVSVIEELGRLAPGVGIVMLTGDSSAATVQAAVRAGAAGFLAKSSPLDTVVAAVRACAAGEAVISSVQLDQVRAGLRSAVDGQQASDLTARERELLALVAEGLTNAAIAERLVISKHTVGNHISNMTAKLGARSKLQMLAIALERGLVERR